MDVTCSLGLQQRVIEDGLELRTEVAGELDAREAAMLELIEDIAIDDDKMELELIAIDMDMDIDPP